MKMRCLKREEGFVMLEGMIVMLMTIIILVFLMSFGFLLYQRWAVTNIANDTAFRIAHSYVYPGSDPIMGYLNKDMVAQAPLFRYSDSDLADEQAERGEKYAAWSLKKSSFAYPVSEPKIEVEEKYDGLARRHIEVRIEAEYEIPFGGALEALGLSKTVTYKATGEGVCLDVLDYVNTVTTLKGLTEYTYGSTLITTVNSVLGIIKNIIALTK